MEKRLILVGALVLSALLGIRATTPPAPDAPVTAQTQSPTRSATRTPTPTRTPSASPSPSWQGQIVRTVAGGGPNLAGSTDGVGTSALFRNPSGVALAPGQMPSALEDLAAVEVQYETLKGWGVSTAGTRKFADLPPAARAYVRRIEQLVGVRRLLKRVVFLFELPARLTKSLELGAHAQAVRYHRVAARLLAQLQHIKSFEAVRRDSDAIMQQVHYFFRF